MLYLHFHNVFIVTCPKNTTTCQDEPLTDHVDRKVIKNFFFLYKLSPCSYDIVAHWICTLHLRYVAYVMVFFFFFFFWNSFFIVQFFLSDILFPIPICSILFGFVSVICQIGYQTLVFQSADNAFSSNRARNDYLLVSGFLVTITPCNPISWTCRDTWDKDILLMKKCEPREQGRNAN